MYLLYTIFLCLFLGCFVINMRNPRTIRLIDNFKSFLIEQVLASRLLLILALFC
mgnify:CR=1 FL=1